MASLNIYMTQKELSAARKTMHAERISIRNTIFRLKKMRGGPKKMALVGDAIDGLILLLKKLKEEVGYEQFYLEYVDETGNPPGPDVEVMARIVAGSD